MASCINTMALNLDKLLPDTQGIFGQITQQLAIHLARLRESRFNAYDYFSGNGAIARKLREALKVDDWINPSNQRRNCDLLSQIGVIFNKCPTKDEAELKALQTFVELTQPLMSGRVGRQEFKALDPTTPVTDITSGFYTIEASGKFLLVLNAKLQPSGVSVCYVLEAGQEERLLYHHPEEEEWFHTDYSFTFESAASHLRSELDSVIAPLGFTAKAGDLQQQLSEVYEKVEYVFNRHARIPASGLQFVNHEKEETQIVIPIGDFYQWRFVDTRGRWPSRSTRFVIQIGSTLQSAEPEDMNEFSRQNMVKSLHIVLDNIIGALAPETAEAL
jgi:hypothetical protein